MFNVQLVLEHIIIQNAAVDVSFTIEVVFSFLWGYDSHRSSKIFTHLLRSLMTQALLLIISTYQIPPPDRQRLSSLEELFEAEDRALETRAAKEGTLPVAQRAQKEIQIYRQLLAVPTSEDPVTRWWKKQDTFPLLSKLLSSYLCVRALSTLLERGFCSANDTISQERSHLLPEQADIQIFLQKNC